MTRKEEREEVARIRANQYSHPVEWNDCYKHWLEGAEWADRNPDGKMLLHVLNKSTELAKKQIIEKVCEYIASNMRCDGYTTQTKAKFIQSLREAMKEDYAN